MTSRKATMPVSSIRSLVPYSCKGRKSGPLNSKTRRSSWRKAISRKCCKRRWTVIKKVCCRRRSEQASKTNRNKVSYRSVQVIGSLLCALTGLTASACFASAETPMLVYLGTYTGAKSQGIYVSRFDPKTGCLTTPELAVEAKNPSFLAVHPKDQFLYAVGEVENFAGARAGSLSAYRIDKASGKLTLLNQQPAGGTSPCHLAV